MQLLRCRIRVKNNFSPKKRIFLPQKFGSREIITTFALAKRKNTVMRMIFKFASLAQLARARDL